MTCFESCPESAVSSIGASENDALFNATNENYSRLSQHYAERHISGTDFDLYHTRLGDFEMYKDAATKQKTEADRILGLIRGTGSELPSAASTFHHDMKRVVKVTLCKPRLITLFSVLIRSSSQTRTMDMCGVGQLQLPVWL